MNAEERTLIHQLKLRLKEYMRQIDTIQDQFRDEQDESRAMAQLDRLTDRVFEELVSMGVPDVAQSFSGTTGKTAVEEPPWDKFEYWARVRRAALESFYTDLDNDPEYWLKKLNPPRLDAQTRAAEVGGNKVFIVHGRNHAVRNSIRLFIQDEMKLETVVMEAGAHKGRTLAEKLEEMAEGCGFAVIIASLDDYLFVVDKLSWDSVKLPESSRRVRRVRQNVLIEIGFFWARLGRNRTAILAEEGIEGEEASDIKGIGYIPITEDLARTKLEVRKELDAWIDGQGRT